MLSLGLLLLIVADFLACLVFVALVVTSLHSACCLFCVVCLVIGSFAHALARCARAHFSRHDGDGLLQRASLSCFFFRSCVCSAVATEHARSLAWHAHGHPNLRFLSIKPALWRVARSTAGGGGPFLRGWDFVRQEARGCCLWGCCC